MPVRKSEQARYPKDWKTAVVPRIRRRSGGRCECMGECGLQTRIILAPGGARSVKGNRRDGLVGRSF